MSAKHPKINLDAIWKEMELIVLELGTSIHDNYILQLLEKFSLD